MKQKQAEFREVAQTRDGDFGYILYKRNDGMFVVVRVNFRKRQVYSCMPGDMPRGTGTWFARWTPSGIDYVSKGYSYSYARRKFREFADYLKHQQALYQN